MSSRLSTPTTRHTAPVRILDVLPVPAIVHHLLQRRLEVLSHSGIRSFVDRDARRGVRNVDECGGSPVELAERLLHQLGDVDELGAAFGLEADLLHGLRILRDDASRPAL
jgi:hypothetical protein